MTVNDLLFSKSNGSVLVLDVVMEEMDVHQDYALRLIHSGHVKVNREIVSYPTQVVKIGDSIEIQDINCVVAFVFQG